MLSFMTALTVAGCGKTSVKEEASLNSTDHLNIAKQLVLGYTPAIYYGGKRVAGGSSCRSRI